MYGRIQNAKKKRRPVNAILHALRIIASRPRQNVKRHARFALLLPQQLLQQLQPQQLVWIYGRLQNAKRKRRPVNAILHALQMIASKPKRNVKRNARFAAKAHTGPTINGVMMKTTIQAAMLMAELVVIITSADGMTIAQ